MLSVDADIVCSRAKTHYDPEVSDKFGSESGVGSGSQNASEVLEAFRKNFKPLHKNQENRMYFMVSFSLRRRTRHNRLCLQ